ncbi:MAG: serine protease, partial [Leptolyngbya sp. SIO4C1]|nr:serine protease [Leptolyngbya sp. SIO4C1]
LGLSSPEFDTYLLLIDESGNRLAENDDVAGSTDSEIVMTLPQTGTYRVIANAYDAAGRGRYRLVIR